MSDALEFYDRAGKPIDLMAWAALRSDETVCSVARDYVVCGDDLVHVSTVWVGIDMSIAGLQLIFETMIFGGPFNEWMNRYCTEAQAFAGHDQALAMVLAEGLKR